MEDKNMEATATTTACTKASHAPMKADARIFAASTTFLGIAPDGDGGHIEMSNCRLCGSTLVREVRQ